ncbi:hypothetical protein SPOG_01607 [Schizosaccharomyces cryophilus OY26]|uniref:Uncharacterized protein n=1 Tax=Schizosaccharomyces cryophilus (strain OY26 / ATCC MYA-4695 / CBS 11777 / NBRC 106824 / NRRL Y48691) TaxID=653667 RepID=S9W176_SCHCR|nr:uncharacterized protein SPOG_01607 [Schizosaccharomyces cryophilus OY26]EPY52269.1 hypothetical protein SPOG_01607 [Schizosaccharomyces cryophilus OY26]
MDATEVILRKTRKTNTKKKNFKKVYPINCSNVYMTVGRNNETKRTKKKNTHGYGSHERAESLQNRLKGKRNYQAFH